jgi:hypothetical protein
MMGGCGALVAAGLSIGLATVVVPRLFDVRSEDQAVLIGAVLGAVAAIAVLLFTFREGFRRSAEGWGVFPDRIEKLGSTPEPHRWEDVRSITLVGVTGSVPARIELRLEDDRKLVIGGNEWKLDGILGALRSSAAPAIAARLKRAADGGERLELRESGWAWVHGLVGAVLLLGAAAQLGLLGWSWFSDHGQRVFRSVRGVFFLLILGFGFITRWGVARGGGIAITRTGIASPRDPFENEIPWSMVSAVRSGKDRLVIVSEGGERTLTLSFLAPNYLAAIELVRSYAPEAFGEDPA